MLPRTGQVQKRPPPMGVIPEDDETRNMDETESRVSEVTNVARVEAGIPKLGNDVKITS